MKIHNEWMSNNELFGNDYEKELQLEKIKNRFDIQRYKSSEGFDVIIDGVPERVLVQNYTNPMNEDREDRKIFFARDSVVKRGSFIQWDNRNFMILTKVDDNQAYLSAKMTECNYHLKWIDILTKTIVQQCCIVENKKRFSVGIQETQDIIVGDGDFQLTLPINEYTKRLKRDDRFLISTNEQNPQAYKISRIDNTSNAGLILINVMENGADLSAYDDKINMISDYYKYFDANGNWIETTPTPPPTPSTGYSITITGSDTLKNTQSLTYTASVSNNGTTTNDTVTWSVDNPTLAQIVSQSGNSITLKGLSSTGTITLTAKLATDNSITISKTITLKSPF